jgi:hypothetical protein
VEHTCIQEQVHVYGDGKEKSNLWLWTLSPTTDENGELLLCKPIM